MCIFKSFRYKQFLLCNFTGPISGFRSRLTFCCECRIPNVLFIQTTWEYRRSIYYTRSCLVKWYSMWRNVLEKYSCKHCWRTSAWNVCINIHYENYRQNPNISHTWTGNKIVDPSDVVGASPVGAAPSYNFILDLTPGFNGLGKDNGKMRRETFKFWDLLGLISEVLRCNRKNAK